MRRLLRTLLVIAGSAVVLLLAVIGALTLLHDPAPARVRAIGEEEGAPAIATAAFVRTASLLTGTTLHRDNQLEVLRDGDGTYPRLWADLHAARRSVNVQVYYVTPGRLLDSLVAVLGERARAGVQVRLLYDGVGADVSDEVVARLRAAGVRTAVFRPVKWYSLHKAQNRSHARIVVIDGAIGYTGGFAIDDRWLGSGQAPAEWRDTNVRATGPVVSQLQASFAGAWSEATGQLLVGEVFFGDSVAQPADTLSGDVLGPAVAGVLHSVPMPGNTRAQSLFSITAAAARERLWITNAYFVPTPELLAMLESAARRGVDVRLLLPGRHTDIPLTRRAARSHYELLLRAGVRLYEYQPAMIHAKTLVADGRWVSIGSMNLDARSFVHNDEVNLLAWDAEAARAVEALFLQDLRHARAIESAAFSRRPWRERLGERFARMLTMFL